MAKTQLICFNHYLKSVSLSFTVILHTSSCFSCHCRYVEFVGTVKYLGIHFYCDITWNTHLSNLCERLRSLACCLCHAKIYFPLSVRIEMTHALVYSILRYWITFFALCSETWEASRDSILKGILRSVSYNVVDGFEVNIFQALHMSTLKDLFVRTAALRHFYNDELKNLKYPIARYAKFAGLKFSAVALATARVGGNSMSWWVSRAGQFEKDA